VGTVIDVNTVDAVLVAVLGAAAAVGGALTAVVAGPGPGAGFAVAVVVLQLVTSPVILVRRRWPVGTGLVIAGSVAAQTVLALAAPRNLPETLLSVSAWAPLALSVAVENITERGIPAARAAWVWAAIGVLTVLGTRAWDPSAGFIANGLLHNAVAPLFGLWLAARRRRLHLLTERAERAEREQWWRAEQARTEERHRLAAELHDLVAHRVTLMTLQAGALTTKAPDPVIRTAADELRANGVRALDELRELVGVLRRAPSAAAPPLAEPAAPPLAEPAAPPLAEPAAPPLAELVEEAGRVGQAVRLTEEGDASTLSPVTGRTAYRIVQEALTNARRHAWSAAVRVDVSYDPHRTRIVVHNDAPASRNRPLAEGGGTGLAGLGERIELIGGSLRAGPDGAGGFRLEAGLPTRVGR
jgi:signal transduction histidine kinase